jgi:putative tryptophan/tyrosine transport system substrate-binding protein
MERHASRLSRRAFVCGAAGLGLVTGCGRLPGQAQPPAKVPRIGVLSRVTADPGDADNAAFRQGLRDMGYSESQNITLEWRSPGGRIDQYPALAADLIGLPVDVIVAQGSAATQAAKQASATIPIVMAFTSEPVRAGLVASLARPGGNVTGLATMSGQMGGKRLDLLRDAVPSLARVALLWNPEMAERAQEFEETAAAAQALGLGLQSVELRQAEDLDSAFASILQGQAEALFLQGDPLAYRYRPEIGQFATAHRLPSISARRAFVEAGGLMSYGPDFPGMNRRGRLLRGPHPEGRQAGRPARRATDDLRLRGEPQDGPGAGHHVPQRDHAPGD